MKKIAQALGPIEPGIFTVFQSKCSMASETHESSTFKRIFNVFKRYITIFFAYLTTEIPSLASVLSVNNAEITIYKPNHSVQHNTNFQFKNLTFGNLIPIRN